MERYIITLLICLLTIIISGCKSDVRTETGPAFEKLAGEVEDLPEESESVPPDLAPLERAVLDDPDSPDARFIYMTGLQRSGDIPAALEQARALIAMEGNHPFKGVAYLNFAYMVLDDLVPDDPSRNELLREAYDGLWIALGIEPESIPAHTAFGRVAIELGEDDSAAHHLSIALSVTEIGYLLRLELGRIFIDKSDTEKARVHLETAYALASEADDRDAMRNIETLIGSIG